MNRVLIFVLLSTFFVGCKNKEIESSLAVNGLFGVWQMDSIKLANVDLLLPNLDKGTKYDGSLFIVNFKTETNCVVNYSTENFTGNYTVMDNDSVEVSNIDMTLVNKSDSKYFKFLASYFEKVKFYSVSENMLKLNIESFGSNYIMFLHK